MLVVNYPSKKAMREQIGERLEYIETFMSDSEWKPDGEVYVCNRPYITGQKREFFARVTLVGGNIAKVA